MMIDNGLEKIRDQLAADGNHSHTSYKFQSDLIFYAQRFAKHGNCLIEVGCFRGGMTSQFAHVARKLGQRLEVIDINKGYLDHARATVKSVCKDDHVNYNECDFSSFAAKAGEEIRPTLILVDADHRYDGVMADIKALYTMKTRPFSVAFHDYSLRYVGKELSDVRVDLALHDAFGSNFPHIKIGEVAGTGSSLRTNPSEDGHYHQIGYPEGVLVECHSLFPAN